MAVNKNFVVKNGLEVATNAIVVDAVNKRVGIGSTIPGVELDVRGNFISTNSYTSGVSTVFNRLNVGAAGGVLSVLGVGGSVGVGTNLPGYLLEVHSTTDTGQTALYVRGDSYVTGNLTVGGDINLDDINTDQIISNTISVAVAGTITRLDATTAGITSAYIANSTGTNLNYTGFATVTGNVQVTGITSSNSFQIGNTQVISSARQLQNIASLDATTTATIETVIQNAPNIFTDLSISGITTLGVTSATDLSAKNLNISGISTLGTVPSINVTGITTLGTVKINTGIITATSGVVTYYGDGQYISNIVRGAGIGTYGTILGYGATVFDFRGSGIGTVTTGSGIGTVYVETIGSRVSISTVPPSNASSKVGDLWYSSILGRTFIYYDEVAIGVGYSSFWIDAAPFNMSVLSSIDNIILSAKTANAPSIGFTTDTSTGFFSPGLGQVTIVSTGSSILNVNSNGVNVTGVTTSSGGFSGNVVGTLLGNVTGNVTGNVSGNVNGYINSPGISTIGNLQSTTLNVTGVSTVANGQITNLNVSGVTTTTTLNVGTGGTIITTTSGGLVGIGTTTSTSKLTVIGDVKVSGVVTASSFVASNGFQGTITAGIAQTSGAGLATSFDFTGIPSWVKRVTVMFNGVSISASNLLVQIGAGSIVSTGYSGVSVLTAQGSNNPIYPGSGFQFSSNGAVSTCYGHLVLETLGSNNWIGIGQIGRPNDPPNSCITWTNGSVSLSGTLDRVRITTTTGIGTFSAGTVNILYEG